MTFASVDSHADEVDFETALDTTLLTSATVRRDVVVGSSVPRRPEGSLDERVVGPQTSFFPLRDAPAMLGAAQLVLVVPTEREDRLAAGIRNDVVRDEVGARASAVTIELDVVIREVVLQSGERLERLGAEHHCRLEVTHIDSELAEVEFD